jgi:branched-chain amino acid transport system permease protein
MASAPSKPAATAARPAAPTVRRLAPLVIFVLLALLPLGSTLDLPGHWLTLVTRAMIFAIAALSLDLVLGIGGLISFGHTAFVGIGAYGAGILISEGQTELLVALPVILLACAVFATVTGYVSLRTRGVAFIMITLAFGQMAFYFAQALSAYGGDDGLTLYEKSTLFGREIFSNRTGFYYIALGTLAVCYGLARRLVASRFGRVLRAARENAVRVTVTGYDVNHVRLGAYVISGMMAGLSGFLLANQTDFVSPAYMSWSRSGELIFMTVLGGVGSLYGAILGALAFLVTEDVLSGLTQNWKAIFGPLIVLFVLFTHGGIAGLVAKLRGRRDG